MKRFISKYRHGLVIAVYSIIYILLFSYLEHRPVHSYHIVHTVFDDWIPFCEFFIVPYMLWFPYMILAVIYFIFFNKNKHEYYQLAFNLMMGMTVFLIVSYVYPNAQHIRPTEFPRDNIFTDIVKWLYSTDTPTNILPSIHVFNSLAIHMSLTNCETLRIKIYKSSILYPDCADHHVHHVPETAFCDRCMHGCHTLHYLAFGFFIREEFPFLLNLSALER